MLCFTDQTAFDCNHASFTNLIIPTLFPWLTQIVAYGVKWGKEEFFLAQRSAGQEKVSTYYLKI